MSRRATIARTLLTSGFVFAALVVACGRAPTRTMTEVGPSPDRGTEQSSAPPKAETARDVEVVETDHGAVVVDRPAPKETSALGGTMGAIVKVITLPVTIILGIFEILF